MSDDFTALAQYGGTARLFPLPNLVLFPQVMQPLHVFEPRYRQMTADALDGDHLIALALLQPGWEADYAGKPAVHPIACLGRIVADQRLEDGRFNILLRGLSRVQIVEEVETGKLYRSARAELLHDTHAPSEEIDHVLRRDLGALVPAWLADQPQALTQFRKLLKSQQPLGMLCDILAFALPLDVEVKQQLLEILNVERRVRRLLDLMEEHKPAVAGEDPKRKFPPDFSAN